MPRKVGDRNEERQASWEAGDVPTPDAVHRFVPKPIWRHSNLHGTGRLAPSTPLPGSLLTIGLILSAAALWALSLRGVDPEKMGNFGLITILPPAFYIALGILTMSFAMTVQRRKVPAALLFLHLLLLTLIIRVTPFILSGTVRYPWTYKHIAIIDYIQRHGSVNRSIDYLSIYHNWPGFFAIGEFFTQLTGLHTALSYANWAPLFFNILDISALLLIYRSLSSDQRLIWLGIWFFEISNWVGQDYFSPQALGHTLFLYVIGICLHWFHPDSIPLGNGKARLFRSHRLATIWKIILRRSFENDRLTEPATPAQRGALISIVILLVFIIVSSHQLSPFMTISALILMVISRQCRLRMLPLFVTMLTATWYIYAAQPFVHSQLQTIIQSLGEFTSNFQAHSTAIRLPTDQQMVAHIAQGLTATVLLLALLGTIRRVQHGHWDLACILLALAPVPWPIVTHYGTEILLRVFLFALPFAAFLGAGFFYPSTETGRTGRSVALISLVSLIMLGALCVAYYGQEKVNYVSPSEVAAMQRFTDTAPPGSLLVQGSWDAPVPTHDYELYHYMSIQEMSDSVRRAMYRDPSDVLESQIHMVPRYSQAYLLITRNQEAALRDIGLTPYNLMARLQRGIQMSPHFKMVFRSRDATMFLLVEHPERSGSKIAEHAA